MLQLARQIVADGTDHYNRFREVAVVLRSWEPARGPVAPWLRPIKLGTEAEASAALTLYREVLAALASAYRNGDMEDAGAILNARQKMMVLDTEAERLAENGIGIPFF